MITVAERYAELAPLAELLEARARRARHHATARRGDARHDPPRDDLRGRARRAHAAAERCDTEAAAARRRQDADRASSRKARRRRRARGRHQHFAPRRAVSGGARRRLALGRAHPLQLRRRRSRSKPAAACRTRCRCSARSRSSASLPISSATTTTRQLPADPAALAHLVMVPNPAFHPRGDFFLDGTRLNEDGVGERLTFSSIGVYRPELVAGETATYFKLLPHFQRAMRDGTPERRALRRILANIGTPEQLRERGAAERDRLNHGESQLAEATSSSASCSWSLGSPIEQLAQERHGHAPLRGQRRRDRRDRARRAATRDRASRAQTASRSPHRRARCRAQPHDRAADRDDRARRAASARSACTRTRRDTRSGKPSPICAGGARPANSSVAPSARQRL